MRELTALGHTDLFLVGDAGMPVPRGVPVVDLALIGGVPTFRQVLDAICAEVKVERYTIAEETRTRNPAQYEYLTALLDGAEKEEIPHAELKKMTQSCKFAVRTGEFTPFSNVVLQAGCIF